MMRMYVILTAIALVIAIAHGLPLEETFLDSSSRVQGYQYGEHCGVNHGVYSWSGSGGGVPIDEVDRLCMVHDACRRSTSDEWYPNCFCNLQLIRGLTAAEGKVTAQAERTRVGLISTFRTLPCRGPMRKNGNCSNHLFVLPPAMIRVQKTC